MSNTSDVAVYRPRIFEFEDYTSLFKSCFEQIEGRILDIESEIGLVRMLLDADPALEPLFHFFSRSGAINWAAIELFQLDEKYTPHSPHLLQSEYIFRHMGEHVKDSLHSFHAFKTDKSLDEGISSYIDVLDSLDGPFYDISIVSMDSDGRIGSLFPKTLAHVSQKPAGITLHPTDTETKERMTITPSTILNSKEIIVIINNPHSIATLAEYLEGKESIVDFPAKFLFSHPYVSIYYCPNNS